MTYNLNWGGGSAPADSVALIKQADADVVALQETHPHWEQLLREQLDETYPHMRFHHVTHRAGGGKAFLSKFPLHEVALVESKTRWFDGWITLVDAPMGEIQLLNVHLRPPARDDGRFSLGALYHVGEHHVEELQRFTPWIDSDIPAIILGDFNEKPSGRGARYLEGHGYTNALYQFDRSTHTWTYSAGLVHLERQMDHIFHTSDLHTYSARVLNGGASDHRPVVAVLGKARVTNSHD